MEDVTQRTQVPVTENDLRVVSKVFKPRRQKETRAEKSLKVLEETKSKAVEQQKVEIPAVEKTQTPNQEELETAFFKIKGQAQGNQQEQKSQVDFTNWEHLSSYAKENGFDFKTPNDIELVFKALKDERKKSEEYEPQLNEFKTKTKSFEDLLVNMPVEIANSFLAWADGKDYKAEIRKITEAPFDITLSVDKQDKLELVNYFSDEKYTKEEWDELDTKVQSALEKSATQLYEVKQHEVLNMRAKANNERAEKQSKFVASVDAAITNLKKDYPDMKESELQEVRKQMLGGINKTLYNDDGTYKETAAKQISMAIYGEKTLGTMRTLLESKMNAEINKIKSGERESILIAGQDGVNLGRGDVSKNKLVEDVRKSLKSVLNRVGK